MRYFQNFEYTIKMNIINSLLLPLQNKSIVAKDLYVKTEWLLVRYDTAYALLYVIKLSHTFIDIAVYQVLIMRNPIISRIYFGDCDKTLIEHNIRRLNADKFQQSRAFQRKNKSFWTSERQMFTNRLSWTNNLPIIVVFTYFIEGLLFKRNDTDIFHFLSAAGPRIINYVEFEYSSNNGYENDIYY